MAYLYAVEDTPGLLAETILESGAIPYILEEEEKEEVKVS